MNTKKYIVIKEFEWTNFYTDETKTLKPNDILSEHDLEVFKEYLKVECDHNKESDFNWLEDHIKEEN